MGAEGVKTRRGGEDEYSVEKVGYKIGLDGEKMRWENGQVPLRYATSDMQFP
jgi:hypothetical protein